MPAARRTSRRWTTTSTNAVTTATAVSPPRVEAGRTRDNPGAGTTPPTPTAARTGPNGSPTSTAGTAYAAMAAKARRTRSRPEAAGPRTTATASSPAGALTAAASPARAAAPTGRPLRCESAAAATSEATTASRWALPTTCTVTTGASRKKARGAAVRPEARWMHAAASTTVTSAATRRTATGYGVASAARRPMSAKGPYGARVASHRGSTAVSNGECTAERKVVYGSRCWARSSPSARYAAESADSTGPPMTSGSSHPAPTSQVPRTESRPRAASPTATNHEAVKTHTATATSRCAPSPRAGTARWWASVVPGPATRPATGAPHRASSVEASAPTAARQSAVERPGREPTRLTADGL